MEEIIAWDHYFFKLINVDGHNNILDTIAPLWRTPQFWIPLYLFFVIYIVLKFPAQRWYLLALVIICAAACDQISSQWIKPMIDRARPCQLPGFSDSINLLIHCGSGKSFTSSHACNHFGLAMILSLAVFRDLSWVKYLLFIWAASVSVAQVYVGVHFPLDILGGACLGMALALMTYFLGKVIFPSRYIGMANR